MFVLQVRTIVVVMTLVECGIDIVEARVADRRNRDRFG